MATAGFIEYSLVYLLAAVIAVPIASRLGLGSVLGYLVAGAIIGPFGLDGVGDPVEVLHAAEFGVVLMLFVIGLELQPSLLVQLKQPVFWGGSAQMGLTTLSLTAIFIASGFEWRVSLALGGILSLSSTAIVLQTLEEKALLKTQGGTHAFGVLLFQDIAVIPMLSLLPLLSVASGIGADIAGTNLAAGTVESHEGQAREFSGAQQALLVLGLAAVMLVVGRKLSKPLFRIIARTRLRELSIAAALLIVFSTAYAMQMIGLSPALGTFLAGLVLADSEYRHELEASIEPFKGLLLGLFFIAVGATIDFELLLSEPGYFTVAVLGLIVIKLMVLLAVGYWQKLAPGENSLFAFSLAQGGEFAFVLLGVAQSYQILTADMVSRIILVVALSMCLTPILMLLNEYWLQPRLMIRSVRAKPKDEVPEFEVSPDVLILGFGRFGQMVGRVLYANGFRATVIDHDAAQIDFLSKFGFKVYYGDVARLDLLRSAGAESATLIVVAIEEVEPSLMVADMLLKHFPNAKVLSRARNRTHAYELMQRGVEHVFRDTFGTAVDMSVEALSVLGLSRHQAVRAGQIFKQHDEHAMKEMFPVWQDEQAYISRAKQFRQQLEYALQQDRLSPQQAESHDIQE